LCGILGDLGIECGDRRHHGSVALPYFEKTAYNPRMVLGSLAAGGAPAI